MSPLFLATRLMPPLVVQKIPLVEVSFPSNSILHN